MRLQHDTHYLTRSLDVRYVVEDKISKNFWSKHSLYNPNNIDNTKEVKALERAKQIEDIESNLSQEEKDIEMMIAESEVLNMGIRINRSSNSFMMLIKNKYMNNLISKHKA